MGVARIDPDVDELLKPHLPALRRYAWGLCRHAEDADDLVQDCLLRAVGHWPSRRPDGNVRAWLFTILYNGFVSGRRRFRLQPDSADDGAHASEAVQEQRLLLREVEAVLATLPEEQRAVLLLVAVEDFSYAEAAQVLGVPVGTVMSRLSRGRERMRGALDGNGTGASRLRRVK